MLALGGRFRASRSSRARDLACYGFFGGRRLEGRALLVSIGLAVPQIKKRCPRPVVPAVNRVSHDPCVKTHQRIRDLERPREENSSAPPQSDD